MHITSQGHIVTQSVYVNNFILFIDNLSLQIIYANKLLNAFIHFFQIFHHVFWTGVSLCGSNIQILN